MKLGALAAHHRGSIRTEEQLLSAVEQNSNEANTDTSPIRPQNSYLAAYIPCTVRECRSGHSGAFPHFHIMNIWEGAMLVNEHRSVVAHHLDNGNLETSHSALPVEMLGAGGTVVRAPSSLQGAETSVTCHVNHGQETHVFGSEVERYSSARGDEKSSHSISSFSLCILECRSGVDAIFVQKFST